MSVNRYPKLFFIVVFAGVMSAQEEDSLLTNEYRSMLRQVADTGPKHNLHVLQQVLNELKAREPERLAMMVRDGFRTLYTNGTDDAGEASRFEQAYTLLALDNPERVPTLLEVDLVLRIRPDFPSTGLFDKGELHRKLWLMFHAWKRTEQDTNPNFDFADAPLTNVSPPHGAGQLVFSGMDPNAITDSRLRAEYQAAIQKNMEKAAEYRHQVRLRNVKGPLIRHVEYVVSAALNAGAATEQDVLSLLSQIQDEEARQRIIAKVHSR